MDVRQEVEDLEEGIKGGSNRKRGESKYKACDGLITACHSRACSYLPSCVPTEKY